MATKLEVAVRILAVLQGERGVKPVAPDEVAYAVKDRRTVRLLHDWHASTDVNVAHAVRQAARTLAQEHADAIGEPVAVVNARSELLDTVTPR